MKYNKAAFEETVNYISIHNKTFFGRKDIIKAMMLQCMRRLADHNPPYEYGTMGFVVAKRDHSDIIYVGVNMSTLHAYPNSEFEELV